MVHFKTKSGCSYTYHPKSNRILLGVQKDKTPLIIERLEEDEITAFGSITHFCIEITRQCNFRCSYCCYSGQYAGHRTHENKTMSNDKILKTIHFIKNNVTGDKSVSICFYGGEALLAQEQIKFFIAQLDPILPERVSYSISTNGYKMNPALIDWICSVPQLSIHVSLDGNSEMHNACRKTIAGEKTYSQIIENLNYFQNKYPDEFRERVNYISTIPDLKSYYKLADSWKNDDFLKQKLPVSVELVSDNKFLSAFKEKVSLLYEALHRYSNDETDDILVNVLLKMVASIKQRSMYDLENGNILLNNCFSALGRCFIDVNGDIAPCETICDSFRIGNVETGFDFEKINRYVEKYTAARNMRCKNCWAFRICQICLICLELTDEEMDSFCRKEQEWSFLSLLLLCEVAEININRKKKFK
jgi:uncharacterized protein